MTKKSDNMMSTQEFHNKQFKDFAVRHYEQLIRAAEQAEDTERLTHLTKRLEKLEAGDLTVAKNLAFVTAGSKLYYDEKQNRVTTVQLSYSNL